MPKILQPTHKQLKKICDKLWSQCIHARAGHKSELSGKDGPLHAHHLVGKPNYLLRYCLNNGFLLTPGEHFFIAHHEGRRRGFEEMVKKIRGDDIYEKLEAMKWSNTKVDLRTTRLYLEEKLREFESHKK